MTESWSRRFRRNAQVFFAHFCYLGRAWRYSTRLPPGKLDRLDRGMDTDQRYGMTCAAKYGPVFKAWWHGSYTTCIVGNARGRQLLADNEDSLAPKSIDLGMLIPSGWIRTMRGDTHQRCRRTLMQALRAAPVTAHAAELRGVIRDELRRLADDRDHPPTRAEVRAAL